MVVSDTASAGYVDDERRKQVTYDGQGEELELAIIADESGHELPLPVCTQCTNWQFPRLLHLSDGTEVRSFGFCTARAAADLPQMQQSYAVECQFYDEDIPF